MMNGSAFGKLSGKIMLNSEEFVWRMPVWQKVFLLNDENLAYKIYIEDFGRVGNYVFWRITKTNDKFMNIFRECFDVNMKLNYLAYSNSYIFTLQK